MAEEKKGSETETLLDYVEVGGYKIRPWGLVALQKLSPHLERIIIGMQTRGISIKDVKDGKGIEKVVFSILPECADVVAITLNATLEEVDKIPPDKVPVIILTILKVNMNYLKNLSGPIMARIKEVAA